MRNAALGKHYIRDWRLHRNLSLRRLADRMESEPGVELISHASLGRIETGQQPYSEPILEALSVALDVPVAHLISRKPGPDAEIVALFDKLNESQKTQALAVLKAIGM